MKIKIVLIVLGFVGVCVATVISVFDPAVISAKKMPYELRVAKKTIGLHTYYRAERKMLLFGLFEFWNSFWVYLEEGEVYSPAGWNMDIKRAERYVKEFKELKGISMKPCPHLQYKVMCCNIMAITGGHLDGCSYNPIIVRAGKTSVTDTGNINKQGSVGYKMLNNVHGSNSTFVTKEKDTCKTWPTGNVSCW